MAILAGVGFGVFLPDEAVRLKPLGDYFVGGIKFLIGPLIFASVAMGIAGVSGAKTAARVGLRSFIYFELMSTFALIMGLGVSNLLKPGVGFPMDSGRLDPALIRPYQVATGSFLSPLHSGFSLIHVLGLAIILGATLHLFSLSIRRAAHQRLSVWSERFYFLISKYMFLAPIGAGASMAFTVGKFGLHALMPLLKMMGCFYLTCVLFVGLILGFVTRYCGIRMLDFLKFIRAEILLVLGTSSSESALAPLMKKMERLGCDPGVVGLVVPTGYSFNLDGTNIYLTLAMLFIAQAFHVELSLSKQLAILAVAMISSKGASGVTGAGFITLAATLSVVPEIPVVGLTLILGVDRFMSEARAITNMIGNGVATLAVSKWEGSLNETKLQTVIGAQE
jgi:aerobic C4-dicarboxylate transport protein